MKSEKQQLNELIEQFEYLNLHYAREEDLDGLFEREKEQGYHLLMQMAGFLTRACGNMNKVYEKTTALALQCGVVALPESVASSSGCSVTHVKHAYGADVMVGKTELEVKSSAVTEAMHRRCNWMFSISVASLTFPCDTEVLFDHVRALYRGYIILNAMLGTSLLKSFNLRGEFFALYVARLHHNAAKGKKRLVINIGGTYCKKHATYHRIEKYCRYDALLKERGDDGVFTEEEWKLLLAREKPCL